MSEENAPNEVQIQQRAQQIQAEYNELEKGYAAVDQQIRSGAMDKASGSDLKLQLRDRAEALQAEFGSISGRLQQQQQREFAEFAKSSGWATPEVAQREAEQLRQHLKSRGYTDQQISGMGARDLKLARDAMKSTTAPSAAVLKAAGDAHKAPKQGKKIRLPGVGKRPQKNAVETHASAEQAAKLRHPNGRPYSPREQRIFRLFGKRPS